jgi:predicted metal-dependent phosphoesterase TrpH
MAALRLANPDDLAIDFHSHTNHSWDGDRFFTAARNRAWHHAAGFDVAYVSDHKSIAGALEGLRANPAHGGATTLLLPSLEARDHSEHVNVLNVPLDVAPDPKGEWHDSTMSAANPPLLILTIPAKLNAIPQTELTGIARLVAIELSDGAPKGIDVLQRDRAQLLSFARAHDLALVAGSDNHGWGSTAVGWTIMRIPGWRALPPTQLDSAIRATLQTQRIRAARVYVRDSPDPGRSIGALALTLPAVIWRELVDLSWPERVSWLCWIVAAVSIASVATSRAAREKTPVAARRNPETA